MQWLRYILASSPAFLRLYPPFLQTFTILPSFSAFSRLDFSYFIKDINKQD